MTQVNDTYKIFEMFNIFYLYYQIIIHNIKLLYYIGIKNDLTSIQSSSTNISLDTFENISKKRKMNESDEVNQETSSKVY